MRVNVTQRDIDLGVPNNSMYCPIARAVRRHGTYKHAFVYTGYISLSFLSDYAPVFLPERANSFVRSFDMGKEVHPFSFTLPDEPTR